jgi:hypothetical protein
VRTESSKQRAAIACFFVARCIYFVLSERFICVWQYFCGVYDLGIFWAERLEVTVRLGYVGVLKCISRYDV